MGEIVTGSEQRLLPRYSLSDDGEFLCVQCTPGVRIEGDDMRSKIAAVLAMSPKGKRPLLVDIGPLERIAPEAKQLVIHGTYSTRIAVVGADDVGRVISAFTYRSATPSRYFTQESDAIAWLLEDIYGRN
ncbi:STAS/SEC14 domain-containing protein [Pseudarthrobacter enclensis]|uniref:STAS/SEC14 domain-containing protein n=1 Tax=Pseudarthrobacter enclensis TaxID=993070 RepID=UPI003416BEAD